MAVNGVPARLEAARQVRKIPGDTMSVNQQTKTEPDRGGTKPELGAGLARLAGPWWLFLLTGIAWLIISMVVLRFSIASAATIGVLLGVVFLGAMANEFLIAPVRWQWGWAHALMGVIFLGGAIWSFVDPLGVFWTLATVVGLLLILQGALVLITSIQSRLINSVWWLGMIAGILEIGLGFWASQQLAPARAALLIIWVGVFAIFRGITEIVLSFELKSLQHR